MLLKTPEHILQAWVDRLIDRIVLPPMWTTGIDHAHIDMQFIAHSASMLARGIKAGIPDIYICQSGGRSIWIELKAGRNDLQPNQRGVMTSLDRCAIRCGVARDMEQVYCLLRDAGFDLHGNSSNIVVEMQARCDADLYSLSRSKIRAR